MINVVRVDIFKVSFFRTQQCRTDSFILTFMVFHVPVI
jgi:hypothetical protein